MIKKAFKSRVLWFLIGGLTLPVIVRVIPVEILRQMGAFVWSQKWGVLIGIGIMIIINLIRSTARGCKSKRGLFGFKIVRNNAAEEQPGEQNPFDED